MFAPDGAVKETITCFTIEELLRSTTIIEKERERSSAQSQSQLRRRGSFALRLRKAWKLARIEWEISFENQFWLVLNHREAARQASKKLSRPLWPPPQVFNALGYFELVYLVIWGWFVWYLQGKLSAPTCSLLYALTPFMAWQSIW